MNSAAGSPFNKSLFAALFFGLAFALGAAGFELYFHSPMLEVGDTALNALQIDHARSFGELYGNYSRFEFNHPGPAFFYAYAAGEWLFHDLLGLVPTPGNAHLLTCMLVQVFFFSLTLSLLAAHASWRGVLPLALLIGAIHFGLLRDPFMSIWPPHVLTMPFIALLASAISVATGQIRHILPLLVTGGVLFHGHVAQPLFVGTLGLLAFVLCHRRLRATRGVSLWSELRGPGRPLLIVSLTVIGLFLLPLAIDAITLGTRSNLATIFGRFYANTDDSKGLFQSLLYFLSFATDARNQADFLATVGPETAAFFSTHGLRVAAGLLVLTSPIVIGWRARKSDQPHGRFLATAGLFLAATIVLCVLWGLAQAGPMEHFNGFFYYGVYYFAVVLLLIALAPKIDPWMPPMLAVPLCTVAAVLFALLLQQTRRVDDEAGLPLQQGIRAALSADPNPAPKLLVFEHASWPTAAGVALELQRNGPDFFITPWWEFMFGHRHDTLRLDGPPEKKAAVWWLTKPGDGGIPVTPELSIFTKPAPLSPTDGEIRLAGGDNGFRYAVTGLTVGNVEFAWTNEPRVLFLFAPQSSSAPVRIAFDAHSYSRDAGGGYLAQSADVYFNDRLVGRVSVAERATPTVEISSEAWNEKSVASLELRFPGAVPKRAFKRPRYEIWYSWGLWKISFGPVR